MIRSSVCAGPPPPAPARLPLLALVLSLCSLACGPASPASPQAPVADTTDAARFVEQEQRALHMLAATDRRIGLRAGIVPSEDDKQKMRMGVIFEGGGSSTVILDGMPDVMSFEARGRALDEAEKSVRSGREPQDERLGFARFIAEERARLARERTLPKAASEIVRAIVGAWVPVSDPDMLAGRDQWLAKRLDDLRASLGSGAMTIAERDELDDALDPLEKKIFGLNASMKALAALRLSLSDVRTTPGHAPRDEELLPDLALFLDWDLGKPPLLDVLRELERDLRADLTPRLAALDGAKRAELGRRVTELLGASPCERREVPGSRIASMAPPPERAAACASLAALCSASSGPEGSLAPLLALHEWAVLATWALHGAPVEAHLMAELESETKSGVTRLALVRPVVAIGAALYAREAVAKNGSIDLPETRQRACDILARGNGRMGSLRRLSDLRARLRERPRDR